MAISTKCIKGNGSARAHQLRQRSVKAICSLALSLSLFGNVAHAQMLPLANAIDGREFKYTVKEGDTLSDLASHFGEDRDVLARENGIDPNDYTKPLVIGQQLTVDNQHIVPSVRKDGTVINLAQRRLFFFRDGQLVRTYLIAAGDPSWQTPTGPFHVIAHIKNKTWMVPRSIQEDMRKKGQPVLTAVPPGPNNPLGGYWVGTSLPNIGIHGTIEPNSIFRYESHGCMRMRHADIDDYFNRVKKGDKGDVIYSSVMLAELPDGRIFMEAHPDVYQKDTDPYSGIRAMAEDAGLTDFINWDKVSNVINKRDGFAIQVGMKDDYKTRLRNWMTNLGADQPDDGQQADPDHTSRPAGVPGGRDDGALPGEDDSMSILPVPMNVPRPMNNPQQ